MGHGDEINIIGYAFIRITIYSVLIYNIYNA